MKLYVKYFLKSILEVKWKIFCIKFQVKPSLGALSFLFCSHWMRFGYNGCTSKVGLSLLREQERLSQRITAVLTRWAWRIDQI